MARASARIAATRSGRSNRGRLQGPRDVGHVDGARDATGGELVAEGGDGVRRRSHPGEARLLDGASECLPLGEEAVPGMDGVRTRRDRGSDDGLDPEVALRGRRWPQPDRRVGGTDVGGVCVRVGVDGDCLHPQLVTGSDDPQRDLAPVGDQHAPEGPRHRVPPRPARPAARLCAKTEAADSFPDSITAGCSHASCGGSSRACHPASRAQRSAAVASPTAGSRRRSSPATRQRRDG